MCHKTNPYQRFYPRQNMTGMVPFSPISSDSMAVGVGAVCGALCRHHAGRLATERIAKDPKLKSLTGKEV